MHKLNHGQLVGKHCFIELRLCVSRATAEKPTLLHRLWLCHDDFVNHDLCEESNCLMGEGITGAANFIRGLVILLQRNCNSVVSSNARNSRKLKVRILRNHA
jgi:hypothetical protein